MGSFIKSNPLEELRKAAGLSQHELAERAGMEPQQVGRLERGERRMTLESIQQLAQALNVSPAAFFPDAFMIDGIGEDARAQPAGNDLDWYRVSASVLEGVETVDVYQIKGNGLSGYGILDGDHLIVDREAEPKPGDVVIVEAIDINTRGVAMIARVYDPPFLLSSATSGEARRPLLTDRNAVRILGPVQAVMRLKQ